MKKGKIIGKKQIVIGIMALSLAVAIGLNMKYAGNTFETTSSNKSDNLGDSVYVNAKADDSFSELREQRTKTRKEAIELLDETIDDVKSDAASKKAAQDAKTAMALRMEKESTIEGLIKAKGFSDALVVLSDKEANIAVKCDKLLDSETLQIQDIAVSQSGLNLENIKIVTVK